MKPRPQLSISGGSGITEGGTAKFAITADRAPDSAITVNVGVSQSGDFGASGGPTVTLSGTSQTYTIATTTAAAADEPDGSVTVPLQSGDGYTVSSSNGAATVTVADNDVPEVNITGSASGTEGQNVTFTLTTNPAPASSLPVNVTITASGDFGASGAATVVVSGASTAYTISTTDDSADEADSSVTATLQAGQGYTVSSSQGSATVAVADHDSYGLPHPHFRYSNTFPAHKILCGGFPQFVSAACGGPSLQCLD